MKGDDTATEKNPPKKENLKKKRKKSKHVVKSIENRNERVPVERGSPSASKAARKKLPKRIIKDPREAASYLACWKTYSDNADGDSGDSGRKHSSGWKFNKNTQSWLIRHMYEADKVSKSTFALLLDYLRGLHGGETKSRLLEDASRRVLRYKHHEKTKEEIQSSKGDEEKSKTEDSVMKESSRGEVDQGNDSVRWDQLNEHDKRKEYKRARKILEIFKDP